MKVHEYISHRSRFHNKVMVDIPQNSCSFRGLAPN